MAEQGERFKHHFVLQGGALSENFRTPGGGGGNNNTPWRDRNVHGAGLQAQFTALEHRFAEVAREQDEAGIGEGFGLRLTFESFPGIELAFESLAAERSGIELLNVRQVGERLLATVFVPDGKLQILVNKLRKYQDEGTDDKPPHAALWNTVETIKESVLKDLWTDTEDTFPQSDDEAFWWEVWLPVRKSRSAVASEFRRLAREQGLDVADGELSFPERTVLMMYGSAGQLKDSLTVLNSMAALRRAKETAEFFDELVADEQSAWVDDLLARMDVPGEHEDIPHICVLDTGVSRGHPLLKHALAKSDVHVVEPAWGPQDIAGHGTNMAGMALLGNATPLLVSQDPVDITHRLESVKLLPVDGQNEGESKHHGYLTMQAVARPEVTAPERKRVFSMAIMSRDGRDWGKPSAWSATVDRLTSGAEDDTSFPRIFVLSAGNIDQEGWSAYPEGNLTDGIHDPGQSWNALTVGAMTRLDQITESDTDGYQPVATYGGLSPQSTTSTTWDAIRPLKPDVIFEGGNAARDPLGTVLTMQSLQLLTTHADVTNRLFDLCNGTSPASALAARMAAQLTAEYPQLWPESIRGLIVHSAEWTQAMKDTFLTHGGKHKQDWVNLVRCCGYGEPSLERARWSVNNSLTLVCEDSLHPFAREGKAEPTLNEMNLHQLPWPLEALQQEVGEREVEMRVTLSYFIEPNPSQRPPKSKYRYESHGLRFDVMRATESIDQFRVRINAATRDKHYEKIDSSDDNWCLGAKARTNGSIHSDTWVGPAVDLANRRAIAVYPVSGWWKLRHGLERYDRIARYALIVSIRAPDVDVDLYTPVSNQVQATVTMET